MLLRRILYWSNFTVIRWQLLLSASVLVLCAWFLKTQYHEVTSERMKVIYIFAKVLEWAVIMLFSFSLFSVLAAWLWFIFRMRGGKINLQVKMGEGEKTEAGEVPVTVTLEKALRPLLGMIRARFVFSGLKLSKPVALDENVRDKGHLFRKGIRGTGNITMYDRGIYDVEEVQIQFCDMMRLVVLPFTVHAPRQLYTLPKEQKQREIKANPYTTEEQTHRIEIPKRVQGELLHYKDFEPGDDIRRIVWKIYARNGELVVRIPETMDPYASHLYFYASFYNELGAVNGDFETELLNRYKDRVRNIFEALEKNEYEIRIPNDQEIPKLGGMSDKKNDLFQVAAASWQKSNPPSLYVQPKKAAFVTLSSLVPAAEVAHVLGTLPDYIPVLVVKMSDAIPSPFRMKWKNIFIVPEKEPFDGLRQPWMISPLRRKIQDNERDIRNMLTKRGNGWLIGTDD